MKAPTLILLFALVFPALTSAYPTDLEMKSEGLDVEAIPTLLAEATVVRLLNNERFAVRCDVRFSNGPEVSRVRKVTIDSGADSLVRFLPSRQVIRLRISVHCWPAEENEEKDEK